MPKKKDLTNLLEQANKKAPFHQKLESARFPKNRYGLTKVSHTHTYIQWDMQSNVYGRTIASPFIVLFTWFFFLNRRKILTSPDYYFSFETCSHTYIYGSYSYCNCLHVLHYLNVRKCMYPFCFSPLLSKASCNQFSMGDNIHTLLTKKIEKEGKERERKK